jgi:hypothetical protein
MLLVAPVPEAQSLMRLIMQNIPNPFFILSSSRNPLLWHWQQPTARKLLSQKLCPNFSLLAFDVFAAVPCCVFYVI